MVAVENQIHTIAFPAISCGAYGYPLAKAAHIAVKTTRDILSASGEIDKVIFALATDEIFGVYQQLL